MRLCKFNLSFIKKASLPYSTINFFAHSRPFHRSCDGLGRLLTMTIESLRYWFNVCDSGKPWWPEILSKGSFERYVLSLERFCEFINFSDALSRPLWRQDSSWSLLSYFFLLLLSIPVSVLFFGNSLKYYLLMSLKFSFKFKSVQLTQGTKGPTG